MTKLFESKDSQLDLFMKPIKDVHTEHCCAEHGCKYGEEDLCTVYQKIAPASYPCSCGEW